MNPAAPPAPARRRRWRRWLIGLAVFALAAPFAGLHVLARVFLGCDPPMPSTVKHLIPRASGGQPIATYWRYVEHPRVTLLFVHGTPASAGAFRSQMEHAFADCDLAVYDRPGFGCTGGGEAAADLHAQGEALCAVIRQARTPRVVLVGHSYGGPVAILAATLLPERVAGVVTIGGSVSPQEEHPWAIQYFGAWPPVAALLPGVVRATNRELLGLRADLVDLDARLPAVRCPVLMLQGDRDAQVPDRNVAYLQARFAALGKSAQLQTRMFPRYNHFMMWEHAPEINDAIAAFLEFPGVL